MDETTSPVRRQNAGASALNIFFGLWLIIAPFVLGYAGVENAQTNDVIVGILVALIAAIRSFGAFTQPAWSWVNVALGIWLILAPFVLDYSDYSTPLWNDIILGIVIAILAWTSASSARRPNLPPTV